MFIQPKILFDVYQYLSDLSERRRQSNQVSVFLHILVSWESILPRNQCFSKQRFPFLAFVSQYKEEEEEEEGSHEAYLTSHQSE